MDKTNSQPKSSNASVGSDQPIEVPETNQPSNASEQPQHHTEPARQARPNPAADSRESAPHDEPPRRSRRYYDDSDDIIERVRRAREAFDKQANAFQGPDWPYYDKRIIVGKKKKESPVGPDNSTGENAQVQSASANQPVAPDKPKE